MTERDLFRVRIALVQAFLRDHQYDGVLLSRVDNFATATGGKRNYVYIMGDIGVCSLFVTAAGDVYYVGTNIEEARVLEEELAGLGCKSRRFLWFETNAAEVVRREFRGNFVSDDGSLGKNVHDEMAYVRSLLTPDELEKYRRLGTLAAEAMTAAVGSVEPGMPEWDIAARLVAEGTKRRCLVPVSLIAADERIAKYRHPIPTEQPLLRADTSERPVHGYVMIVGCFWKEGLVASITRFRQVGDIPASIHDAYARVAGVDALMQEASEPGKTLGDVFSACQEAYARLGFPANEWHNHHQGGTAGYAGRTCKATPGEPFPILEKGWSERVKEISGVSVEFGQAFAWNPSAVGVKSEDTFILMPDGRKEIVTTTPTLPRVDLEAVLGRKTTVTKSGIAGP
ncbi:MAG TPA: M24 family metallopeptidase [Candidatus Bathyarchaeia archaeon]|nr:M24 family metallopeptidase [Candidatus Bathyarchaeia archaeon]